ncbi:MAG TPA: DUF4112 domain-containing protein [Polyangiaceae bacterium]|nr:DUF4112 domain-containing protein [Polyangiaceae bacterium]
MPPSKTNAPRSAGQLRLPAWLPALVRLLDSAFEIPGTRLRVGLDPILGLIAPGAGDAVGGIAALSVLWVAFTRRVPKVVLLRMLVNLIVDALIGVIPVLGDIFDVAYRANQKNLELLQRHAGQAHPKPTLGDYAIVGLAFACVLALLALPILIGLGAVHLIALLTDGS